MLATPRLVYVARSFLDYRIPVFEALDELTGGNLRVIYSGEVVPERVQLRLREVLGERANGLKGEKRIGPKVVSNFANESVRVVYQPGVFRAIAECRPDVLVGDGFFQWTAFALLYRITRRVPLVVTYERTFHTERSAQTFRTWYRRFALRWVDAMACNGQLSREYTASLGMLDERVTLGQMAADTQGLSEAVQGVQPHAVQRIRDEWGSPSVVLLSVAQLVPRKGFAELLAGWGQSQEALSGDVALVIVGDGPERERLDGMLKGNGLQNVHFVGSVDYNDISSYYAAADAFVIPTLEDNWSLVVPEAMACGLPILCSKYNGCWPELVQQRNGWVFDPLDTADTKRALEACIAARENLLAMGQASREIVAEHTPERAARTIYDACQIALRRRGGRSFGIGAEEQAA